MAEYKVKINERTKRGRLFLEFIRDYASSSDIVSISKDTRIPNAVTRKAMKDAELGHTTSFSNWKDFENDMD